MSGAVKFAEQDCLACDGTGESYREDVTDGCVRYFRIECKACDGTGLEPADAMTLGRDPHAHDCDCQNCRDEGRMAAMGDMAGDGE